MDTLDHSLDEAIKSMSPGLGQAFSVIKNTSDSLSSTPAQVSWEAVIQNSPDLASPEALLGALAVLYGMNAIQIENGLIRPTTKSACFLLGSVGKYLELSNTPETSQEELQTNLCLLTEVYERARRESHTVDRDPIHRRRIVNLVIKKRMRRDFREQDVYLHVYHPKWKAYHLIGLGQKKPEETDAVLISKAMSIRLGLMAQDYEVSTTFNPSDLSLIEISQTNGALTEYTFHTVFVKSIARTLDFGELTKADKGPFRWFTMEEINRRCGSQGEPIMFSTPVIMRHIQETDITVANRLPLTRVRATDIKSLTSLRSELGRRLTSRQLFALVVLPVTLVILLQLILILWPQITSSTPVFTNLASIATIVGLVPALYAAFLATPGLNRARE